MVSRWRTCRYGMVRCPRRGSMPTSGVEVLFPQVARGESLLHRHCERPATCLPRKRLGQPIAPPQPFLNQTTEASSAQELRSGGPRPRGKRCLAESELPRLSAREHALESARRSPEQQAHSHSPSPGPGRAQGRGLAPSTRHGRSCAQHDPDIRCAATSQLAPGRTRGSRMADVECCTRFRPHYP